MKKLLFISLLFSCNASKYAASPVFQSPPTREQWDAQCKVERLRYRWDSLFDMGNRFGFYIINNETLDFFRK